jgi:hypothetical protein
MKERNGKYRLAVKPSYLFVSQVELCRAFKRGLYKMYFEESGYETNYDVVRNFARYDNGDLPVLYFTRRLGIIMLFKSEAETPIVYFDRMNYLYSNEKFVEIEFLGHVFGLPIAHFTKEEFQDYARKSKELKKDHFVEAKIIQKFDDIDISLSIMNS